MAPQKRKADAALPEPNSDESPHKRAKSESIPVTLSPQNEIPHSLGDASDDRTGHPVSIPKPSSKDGAAGKTEHEATARIDLPKTWDQATAADKMLVDMKENTKTSWARIEQSWERSTGEKPAKGMLRDRYQHLKVLKAKSKDTDGTTAAVKAIEEPVEILDRISVPPTDQVRSTSPVAGGPSDESSHSVMEESTITTKPSGNTCTAPADDVKSEQEVDFELDLPQSWDQASAGDQLIVKMKTSRKSWSKIDEAWEQLTGERPVEGALRDRYIRIKDVIICPKASGGNKINHRVNLSSLDEITDQAISRHQSLLLRMTRKRKTEAEVSERPLDESSHESSHESSDEISKPSTNMTRRRSRGTAQGYSKASTLDESSDGPIRKRTKSTAAELSNRSAEADPSKDLNEASKTSSAIAKSATRLNVKAAVAAAPSPQDQMQTPDEMLVAMREGGSTWVEVAQAWNERTGLAYVPETLRVRYGRIKSGSAKKLPSITSGTSAPQKRKAEAGSPEQGAYESSGKRSKPTVESPLVAETPIKRNVDRGKRKTSVKYTDSTTDEDELYAAPVEPPTKTSVPARRGGGRASKVDRTDPEWLVTNEKSPLADEDLHAEFSNPKTYENFTKSDWEDLRETLPSNVPINPDGYSIPMTFFKYDPDFRRGIREFQEDLASGRLDPKWQADAAEAMEERARGEFDAYKEDQFEAFWGQKQKLDHDALAGESTKIKLDLLIQNNIFKVGDYFSYSRVFGRGKNGVLIEKDCKIVELDNKTLTFAIPPAQRKYSRHMFESGTQRNATAGAEAAAAGRDDEPQTNVNGKLATIPLNADTEVNGGEASEASGKANGTLSSGEMPNDGSLPGGIKPLDAESATVGEKDEGASADATKPDSTAIEANIKPSDQETNKSMAVEDKEPSEASANAKRGQSSTTVLHKEEEEDIIHSISNLTHLEHKIVDIDGRFNSKDISIQNAWKNFRGIRNHQDLGSLFEMREDFYVYKHPRIVKEAKRKR